MGRPIEVGIAAWLALFGLACSPETGGQGSGLGMLGEGSGDDTTGNAGTGMADGTGAADGNATGGGTTNTTSPGTGGGPATTMPPGSSDDGSSDEGSSGDGEPKPAQEVLERASFANCNRPLWCLNSGTPLDPFDPLPNQRQRSQECFQASLTPPFELTELEFHVAMLTRGIGEVLVQVYGHDGAAGPGALLADRAFDPGSLTEGLNAVKLEPPLLVNQQNFCIGVVDPGMSGALGVAVDESSLVGDVSFADPDCVGGSWIDVIDVNPTPMGNWCIRGVIQEQ